MNTSQYSTIFEFITAAEDAYKKPISVNGKQWSMKDTITTAVLYRDSDIIANKTDMTPIRNITRPILNLQYRTEDIDVKDVQIYVDEPDRYHLSFLVKRYHDDVFTKEYDIDSFFDELNQNRVDFGSALSKSMSSPCPEVVPLQSIAFCDQTDILSGPIGLKHYYSPDQLLDMKKAGWGNKAKGATATLEDVIVLSREQKKDRSDGTIVNTPGRYIEIYEVHGNLPKKFADSKDDSGEYETQLFIVAFYQKKDNDQKAGIVLYCAPEPESPFKLVKRSGKADVFGRALGFGGAEELFEAQVWTNYAAIRQLGLLDATSKVLLQTDDPAVTQKQNVRDLENLSVIDVAPNTSIRQVDTTPRSMVLFENAINEWENHAKDMGAAQDPVQGKAAKSGTPFASVQSQIQQSQGLHDYRRGIFAKHLEEIYQDWIIPHIQKKITEGTTFLAELSLSELQMVSEALITNTTNQWVKNEILSLRLPTQQQIDQYKQQAQAQFQKRGNKHFIEILKGEFKDVDLGVKVSIAGKSKDLSAFADKLVSIVKAIPTFAPFLHQPPVADLLNKTIEAMGLDPIDFNGINFTPMPQRRITTSIDYKDLDPDSQKELLTLDGIIAPQETAQQPTK